MVGISLQMDVVTSLRRLLVCHVTTFGEVPIALRPVVGPVAPVPEQTSSRRFLVLLVGARTGSVPAPANERVVVRQDALHAALLQAAHAVSGFVSTGSNNIHTVTLCKVLDVLFLAGIPYRPSKPAPTLVLRLSPATALTTVATPSLPQRPSPFVVRGKRPFRLRAPSLTVTFIRLAVSSSTRLVEVV